MNAEPQLNRIAAGLKAVRLEAIMIGNAAAALNGAPVTTLDFDFLIRDTEQNNDKLIDLANHLDASLLDQASPLTSLRRIENPEQDLYLDFLTQADGISSFASLRSRAHEVDFGGASLLIADLKDVIASKEASNRSHDRAVLETLKETLDEREQDNTA